MLDIFKGWKTPPLLLTELSDETPRYLTRGDASSDIAGAAEKLSARLSVQVSSPGMTSSDLSVIRRVVQLGVSPPPGVFVGGGARQ